VLNCPYEQTLAWISGLDRWAAIAASQNGVASSERESTGPGGFVVARLAIGLQDLLNRRRARRSLGSVGQRSLLREQRGCRDKHGSGQEPI